METQNKFIEDLRKLSEDLKRVKIEIQKINQFQIQEKEELSI